MMAMPRFAWVYRHALRGEVPHENAQLMVETPACHGRAFIRPMLIHCPAMCYGGGMASEGARSLVKPQVSWAWAACGLCQIGMIKT